MKVYCITREEPFYLPVFFERLFKAGGHQFVGITILAPRMPKQGFARFVYDHLVLYGLKDFIVHSFLFYYYKFLDKLRGVIPQQRFYAVSSLARHYGVKIYPTKSINQAAFLSQLRDIQPDVVVSVTSPQVFKKKLLALPAKGCINVHGGPLPRYRGVLPSFWALANGARETAATVHYIDEGLDSGKIILQEYFLIEPEDTMLSLIARGKQISADLLIKALKQIEDGTVSPQENDSAQATYYTFPDRAAVKRFRSQGRRVG